MTMKTEIGGEEGASTSPGTMPASHRELDQSRSFPSPSEGTRPADTFIWGLRPLELERIHFCCPRHSALVRSVTAAHRTHAGADRPESWLGPFSRGDTRQGAFLLEPWAALQPETQGPGQIKSSRVTRFSTWTFRDGEVGDGEDLALGAWGEVAMWGPAPGT